jgi:sec-independent protein translocase protein TatA
MFSEGRQILAATPRQPFQREKQRGDLVVHGLFGLGVPELAVIAGVAALLFGPKQLPEIGKSLGKTVKSFSQAAKEFQSEIQTSTEAQAEVKSTTMPTTPVEEPKVAPPATTATSEKDSA